MLARSSGRRERKEAGALASGFPWLLSVRMRDPTACSEKEITRGPVQGRRGTMRARIPDRSVDGVLGDYA